ncbi:hypothetical protein ABKN59_009772 [Abortiporus biennis]
MPSTTRKKLKMDTKGEFLNDDFNSNGPSPTPEDPSVQNPTHSRGRFAQIPNELLDLILSEYPRVKESQVTTVLQCTTFPLAFAIYTEVLRALSQTCRSLRIKCLSRLWERVEICYVKWEDRDRFGEVTSRNLDRISKGLSQTPEIGGLVRSFAVTLTRWSTKKVLSAFVKCLTMLPNLHTLQVLYAHPTMAKSVQTAFRHNELPQIRTVILPNYVHSILRSCTGVETITCNEEDGGRFLAEIRNSCPHVRSLRNIAPNEALLKRLPKYAPSLETIALNMRPRFPPNKQNPKRPPSAVYYDMSIYQKLKQLPKLSKIELIVYEVNKPEWAPKGSKIREHISAARDMLKGNQAEGEKSVVFYYRPWNDENGEEIEVFNVRR